MPPTIRRRRRRRPAPAAAPNRSTAPPRPGSPKTTPSERNANDISLDIVRSIFIVVFYFGQGDVAFFHSIHLLIVIFMVSDFN